MSAWFYKLRSALAAASMLRQLLRGYGGMSGLLGSIDAMDTSSPRSLNGCDRLLLPKILKDFPDFDIHTAKSYAKDYLREKLGSREGFTIYNVVISQYLPTGAQKTIVFQAAISYRENSSLLQKRYDLRYCYQLAGSDETVAANCPNCGGALGYGVTVCPYCDSRVTSPLGNSWNFTEIEET